jgi:hypothetical protein
MFRMAQYDFNWGKLSLRMSQVIAGQSVEKMRPD